jgi:FAD/FMN-containing dehydrogenase
MRGVRVDPHAGTVRVQAGATLGDIDREAQVFGLAVPAGVVASTGVAGLTLTGGTGWQMRKRGLTIDNLLSVDIVTADGELRVGSGTENADLFWALRGGGGNFGVVTSFEYQAYPVGPTVLLGCPWYPADIGADVLSAWRDFMTDSPEEFGAIFQFGTVPAHPDFPMEHHGKAAVVPLVTYTGDLEEGARLIKPLRTLGKPLFDQSGPLPWLTLQRIFDPFAPKGGLRYYWKSAYLSGLGQDVIDHLVELASRIPSPDTSVIVLPFGGGAVSRVGDGDTAFGRRDIPYMLELNSAWAAPADDERNIDWTRQAWSQIQRFSLGGGYLVYPGFGEDEENLVRSSVGAANYSKLVAIKDRYDPANLFRSNMNIKPTAERSATA